MKSSNLLPICSLYLLAALALPGCTGAQNPATVTPSPAAGDSAGNEDTTGTIPRRSSSDFDIRMHRSGCFGRCPSYSVWVTGEGAVEFSGERFVSVTGTQRSSADPARLKVLRELLDDPAISALDGDYTPADPKRCGVYATDFPSVSIEIGKGTFPRKINHYLGCPNAPKQLLTLEQAIDDAAGTARWTGTASRE